MNINKNSSWCVGEGTFNKEVAEVLAHGHLRARGGKGERDCWDGCEGPPDGKVFRRSGGCVVRWGLGFSWALGEVGLLRPGTDAARCKGALRMGVCSWPPGRHGLTRTHTDGHGQGKRRVGAPGLQFQKKALVHGDQRGDFFYERMG